MPPHPVSPPPPHKLQFKVFGATVLSVYSTMLPVVYFIDFNFTPFSITVVLLCAFGFRGFFFFFRQLRPGVRGIELLRL